MSEDSDKKQIVLFNDGKVYLNKFDPEFECCPDSTIKRKVLLDYGSSAPTHILNSLATHFQHSSSDVLWCESQETVVLAVADYDMFVSLSEKSRNCITTWLGKAAKASLSKHRGSRIKTEKKYFIVDKKESLRIRRLQGYDQTEDHGDTNAAAQQMEEPITSENRPNWTPGQGQAQGQSSENGETGNHGDTNAAVQPMEQEPVTPEVWPNWTPGQVQVQGQSSVEGEVLLDSLFPQMYSKDFQVPSCVQDAQHASAGRPANYSQSSPVASNASFMNDTTTSDTSTNESAAQLTERQSLSSSSSATLTDTQIQQVIDETIEKTVAKVLAVQQQNFFDIIENQQSP